MTFPQEVFYLTYTTDDVEGSIHLDTGDKVSFYMDTNKQWVFTPCLYYLEDSQLAPDLTVLPVVISALVRSALVTFSL